MQDDADPLQHRGNAAFLFPTDNLAELVLPQAGKQGIPAFQAAFLKYPVHSGDIQNLQDDKYCGISRLLKEKNSDHTYDVFQNHSLHLYPDL